MNKSACERKKGYRTVAHAVNAACGRKRGTGKNLRVYECPDCGMFHLTSIVKDAAKHVAIADRGRFPDRSIK